MLVADANGQTWSQISEYLFYQRAAVGQSQAAKGTAVSDWPPLVRWQLATSRPLHKWLAIKAREDVQGRIRQAGYDAGTTSQTSPRRIP